MANDFISFTEGENYLLGNTHGLPATCYFLLSTKRAVDFTAADTLAGGVAEISGTGYSRQSQAAPTPSLGQAVFSQMTWNTGSATNWSNTAKSIVLATSSDNSGKAICAWNLLASLNAPTGFTVTPVTSGGTFSALQYFWVITATNAAGQTKASQEVTAYMGASYQATLAWTAVAGATGYKIYRASTSGGQTGGTSLVTTIGSGATVTYTDTGAALSAGSVPASNTTASSRDLSTANTSELVTPTLTTAS